MEGSERFAKRYDQDISGDVEKTAEKAKRTAKDVADGNVSISTIYEEAKLAAKRAANKAVDVAQDPGKALDAAKEKAAKLVQAVDDWRNKPPEEQLDDLAHTAVSGTENAILGTAGHVFSGVIGGVRTIGRLEKAGGAVAEGLGDVAQGSKKSRKAAARAARAEQEVAEHTAPAVGSASELPSSRAARRESMRQAGIPTSQQPIKQTKTIAGYQYEYEVQGTEGRKLKAVVTQQTTDRVENHGPHWESGMAKEPIRKDGLGRLRVDSNKAKVVYVPAK